MSCNNTYCYWNAFGSCCHESEEGHLKAIPNTLDCPSSLRKDFEEQLYCVYNECIDLLDKRSMIELMEIRSFILSQRKTRTDTKEIKWVPGKDGAGQGLDM